MRVSDYIARYIHRLGINHVFYVSGGGMMFLSDGLASCPEIKAVSHHHEQAAAMAGVAYAKYSGHLGAVYLTTGCGATNGITGLLNAWQDNTPVLFVSGQSKVKETVANSGLALRQFGVQEADIIPVVHSLTKYAVMITGPEDIRYHLEKAVHLATTGRPGPVWIDVPLDIQGAQVDEKALRAFDASEMQPAYKMEPAPDELAEVRELMQHAKRPLIVAGQGVRLSKSITEFLAFAESYNIPAVMSRLGIDLMPTDHPLNIGRIGNKGDRAGNFAVQNADLLLVLGSRLSVSSTGHEYALFAREAKTIVVDIDPVEHRKNTVRIDLFVNADVGKFLRAAGESLPHVDTTEWRGICLDWKQRYPVDMPEYRKTVDGVSMYHFVDRLSRLNRARAPIVSDAGSAFYVTSQAVRLGAGERYITSGGQAEMGFSLPAAIGVCFACDEDEVIAITGDGSLQLNIQELQTLVHHQLPVKLFVWNNGGYLSIITTQSKYFEGRLMGCTPESGVTFPSLRKIARAYGIWYRSLDHNIGMDSTIRQVLRHKGPAICEVMCSPGQEVIPTITTAAMHEGRMVSRPLEDMYPFLDREEFRMNMIVKLVPDEPE